MEYFSHLFMFRDPRTSLKWSEKNSPWSMDRGSRLTVIMSSLEIYFGVVKVFDQSGNKVGGNNSRKYPFPKHHESPSKRTLCVFVDLEENDIFPIEPPRQVLKFSVTENRFAESHDTVDHFEK